MADARVVHENVEAPDLCNSFRDRLGAGYIEANRLCRPNQLCQRLGGSKVDVGDINECASASQFLDRSFADTAGAARHKHAASLKAKSAISTLLRCNLILVPTHSHLNPLPLISFFPRL